MKVIRKLEGEDIASPKDTVVSSKSFTGTKHYYSSLVLYKLIKTITLKTYLIELNISFKVMH